MIYGKIKSLKCGKERILKQSKSHKGYLYVNLYKNGKSKKYSVHKLVAEAFIPNPEGKPEINHDDGNKENCCASNLYWSTRSENVLHAYRTGLYKNPKKHCNNKAKAVNQYDLDGNFIKTWESTMEVERELKINNSSISKCCLGKRNKAGGYIWKFKDTQ